MLLVVGLLGAIIGLMLGWYARTLRDLLALFIDEVDKRRTAAAEKRADNSGVIIKQQPYQRGQVVNLPHYDGGAIVRARTPQQVKQDDDRDWQKTLNEFR